MNAARVPIAARHLPHAPQKVLMVVLVQTPALHPAIIDVEGYLKGNCPMPFILKLASLHFARLHGLPGHGARQGLDVRFFVHTDHHFPALVKPVDTLITPQDLGGPGGKLLINGGSLPIAAAMRLQTSLRQDPGHRRVVNGGNHCLLHDDLLQTAAVPMSQAQSVRTRVSASHPLNLHPSQRGKKPSGVRSASHQRSLSPRVAGSAATNARPPSGSPPASGGVRRCVPLDPRPTAYGLASRHAAAVAHPSRSRANSAARQPGVY